MLNSTKEIDIAHTFQDLNDQQEVGILRFQFRQLKQHESCTKYLNEHILKVYAMSGKTNNGQS